MESSDLPIPGQKDRSPCSPDDSPDSKRAAGKPEPNRGRSNLDIAGGVASPRDGEASLVKVMPFFANHSKMFVSHSGSSGRQETKDKVVDGKKTKTLLGPLPT